MNRSSFILFALTGLWASAGAAVVNAIYVAAEPEGLPFAGVVAVGLILIVGFVSLLSLVTHGVANLRARRGPAIDVMLSARIFEDEEATTYEVIISAGTRRWISPAYGGRGVRYILANGRVGGRAWFDPQSGLPVSIEANGQAITTYPTVREVPGE